MKCRYCGGALMTHNIGDVELEYTECSSCGEPSAEYPQGSYEEED